MRKPEMNLIVDTLAFFAFLFLVSTGFLIYWILPAGHGHLSIWGLNRHGWGEIHFWIAIFFLLLISFHFILHWTWIKTMFVSFLKKHLHSTFKTSILIGFLLLLLLATVAPFLSPVKSSKKASGSDTPHFKTEYVIIKES